MACFRSTFALFTILLLFLSMALVHMSLGLSDPTPSTKLKAKFPPGIPNKFDPDGNVQPFPGNSIICHLPNSTELYVSLLILYNQLKKDRLSHLYVLLPPSSWHMTVFDGVVDKNRKPGNWPSNLATNATLEQCTAKFARQLSTFDLQTELPYHISINGLSPFGLGFSLEPRAADSKALRNLRDRLAEVLHLRRAKHEQYRFHLTLAYLLRYLTPEQKEEIDSIFMGHLSSMPKNVELGAPQFCAFDDMFSFEPLLSLENKVDEHL